LPCSPLGGEFSYSWEEHYRRREVISEFTQALRGPVIGRNHPEYEEARKLYNTMIDKHPLLIARCADVGDAIAAVNFGRENKLPIAIRRPDA
jgi:hypothetical protein